MARKTKRLKGGDKVVGGSRRLSKSGKFTRFGSKRSRRIGIRRRKSNKGYRNGNFNINWGALKELTWKQWIGLFIFLAVIGLIILAIVWYRS